MAQGLWGGGPCALAARLMAAGLALAGTMAPAVANASDSGPTTAWPVLDGLASPGYTGLAMLPSPRVLGWGRVQLGYDTALPGYSWHSPRGHNLLLSVGPLPHVEVTGRLATKWWGCNLYGQGPDPCASGAIRDLSASLKIGHAIRLGGWSLGGWHTGAVQLQMAVGATDLGGAATNFRSAYGVVGLEGANWRIQLGQARAHSPAAPLNSGFAGIAWRPLEALQLQAEAIGHRRWLSARLVWPERWRPSWVTPWLSLQRSLQRDGWTPPGWWSVGVNIALEQPQAHPLDATGQPMGLAQPPEPALPRLAADRPQSQTTASRVAAASGPPSRMPGDAPPPPAGGADWADGLALSLARQGFEDIAVGEAGAMRIVVAENSGYAWNDLDAVGLALGLVTDAPLPDGLSVDLRITRRGLVVWRVLGDAHCLRSWLRQPAAASAGSAADAPRPACAQPLRFLAGARAAVGPDGAATAWWVQGHRASLGRPRLSLAVDLDSRIGTEYGTLDTSAGVDLTLQLPLWRGAAVDLAYVQALGHSRDYDPGEAFSDFRIDSQIYRVMLHQAVDLAPGLAARVSAGRLFRRLDGGTLELRWQPGDGRHRLSLDASHYRHTQVDFTKRSHMAAYRYFAAPLQTAFELRGGQFWHGDQGAVASMKHWFGDVSLAFVLRRSHFLPGAPQLYSPYGSHWVNAAGVEFTFPLTPRREHVGRWLQLRGQDRFGYGVQSVVGQKSSNYLTPWFGRLAPVPMGLADSVDNFDRASQAYLDANLHRLREAWRVLGAGH